MPDLERAQPWIRKLLRPSLFLGLATLAIHVAANGGYGFFRDELYFIVCGQISRGGTWTSRPSSR